jgi:hypothetical protein
MPDSAGYYCFIQSSKKDKSQMQISEYGELTNLVKSIGKFQKLDNPILGSPYESIFIQQSEPGKYKEDAHLTDWIANNQI